MNKIFIEARHERTSEYNFIHTVLSKFFSDKEFKIICIDGVENLFSEAILNEIQQAEDEGDKALVLVDADFVSKGWGYSKRKEEIVDKMKLHEISFPLFVYPNNSDDGDVEVLMENLVRKDLHQDWWDCFEDYEICVKSAKDETGSNKYNIPNRKAKLHTFISSQILSKKQRDKLGRGFWLFDDTNYWDLSRKELNPLCDFFAENLQ